MVLHLSADFHFLNPKLVRKGIVTATDTDPEYRIRYLEKENDRLIEAVKHVRQNALALVAAVLVLISTMMGISKPLTGGLKTAQYDSSWQTRLLGERLTPEREAMVQHLTLLWNLSSSTAIAGGTVTIFLAIFIFMKTGRYAPTLDKAYLESMTLLRYGQQLLEQHEQLKVLNLSFRRRLIWAFWSAGLTVTGCAAVTLLWLWFGDAPQVSP
jgi:hypothetical protein